MLKLLQIDPQQTEELKGELLNHAKDKVSLDVFDVINRANVIRRIDFNVWTASYLAVVSEKCYVRLYISTLPENGINIKWILYTHGSYSGNYAQDSWHFKTHLRDISLKNIIESPAALCVHVFENDRIFDSLQHACHFGKTLASPKKIYFSLEEHRCLVNPKSFYKSTDVEAIEVDRDTVKNSHQIKAISLPPGCKSIIEFGKIAFGESRPTSSCLLISLDAEKRIWTNQKECLSRLISIIKPERVYLNGMTAAASGKPQPNSLKQEEFELQLMVEIIRESGVDVDFVSLYNKTIEQKVEAFKNVSFFIAPGGSAFLIPNIMGIPGIIVGNKSNSQWRNDFDNPRVKRVAISAITERDEPGFNRYSWGFDSDYVSYEIDPDVLVSLYTENFLQN